MRHCGESALQTFAGPAKGLCNLALSPPTEGMRRDAHFGGAERTLPMGPHKGPGFTKRPLSDPAAGSRRAYADTSARTASGVRLVRPRSLLLLLPLACQPMLSGGLGAGSLARALTISE